MGYCFSTTGLKTSKSWGFKVQHKEYMNDIVITLWKNGDNRKKKTQLNHYFINNGKPNHFILVFLSPKQAKTASCLPRIWSMTHAKTQ